MSSSPMFYAGMAPAPYYSGYPNSGGYPGTMPSPQYPGYQPPGNSYSPYPIGGNSPYGQMGGQAGGQNLLNLLLGALGGSIPGYGAPQGGYGNLGGYGNTGGYGNPGGYNSTQYGPITPSYNPYDPASANIDVKANSPYGSARSIGNAFGGSYATTTGNAFTNIFGAGAQNSSTAYGPMPTYSNPYGGYGNNTGYGNNYGGNYGGGSYTSTQTYSQSVSNGMAQYPPTYPSYPPATLPPVLTPYPQPIYNYGSSQTSTVAGPGSSANATAGQ